MSPDELSIGELADAAGLSRRAVRFYVQQQLLPAPKGRGRGKHYDPSHLRRLERIAELQGAGHSLEAIRRILEGRPAPTPPPEVSGRARPPRSKLAAELWTRLRLADGVELHFSAARYNPDVEQLLALRAAVRSIFHPDPDPGSDESGEANANGNGEDAAS